MITDELLAAAKRRLAELDAEAGHLRALVAIYEGRAPTASASPQGRVRQQDDGQGRRGKRVPADWIPILVFLSERRDDTVHMDEVNVFSDEAGLGHSRNRLRAQMHNWKVRGWVESPAQSMFRITQAGVEVAAEHDNGADQKPAPSPTFESESGAEAEHHGPDLLNPNAA